jgi:hypothetical protein
VAGTNCHQGPAGSFPLKSRLRPSQELWRETETHGASLPVRSVRAVFWPCKSW